MAGGAPEVGPPIKHPVWAAVVGFLFFAAVIGGFSAATAVSYESEEDKTHKEDSHGDDSHSEDGDHDEESHAEEEDSHA